MTSSLVGSEMCIRDRRAVAPGGARKEEQKMKRRMSKEEVDHGTQIFWTVSYTHLTLPTICSV
eukprot:1492872-Prorocentrum_lima.AAC.1